MAGLIRIVVATRDDARLDALHERAQGCEIGARVGARWWQRELLRLIGDGALCWSMRARKRDLKQMIRSISRFDPRYRRFYPLNACLLITTIRHVSSIVLRFCKSNRCAPLRPAVVILCAASGFNVSKNRASAGKLRAPTQRVHLINTATVTLRRILKGRFGRAIPRPHCRSARRGARPASHRQIDSPGRRRAAQRCEAA